MQRRLDPEEEANKLTSRRASARFLVALITKTTIIISSPKLAENQRGAPGACLLLLSVQREEGAKS